MANRWNGGRQEGGSPRDIRWEGVGAKDKMLLLLIFFLFIIAIIVQKGAGIQNVCKDLAPAQCSLPSQDDGCQNLFTNCVVVGSDFVAIDH